MKSPDLQSLPSGWWLPRESAKRFGLSLDVGTKCISQVTGFAKLRFRGFAVSCSVVLLPASSTQFRDHFCADSHVVQFLFDLLQSL